MNKMTVMVALYVVLAGCSVRACNHKPDMASIIQDACPPGMMCLMLEPLELAPETPVERFERECDEASMDSERNRGHEPWRYCA